VFDLSRASFLELDMFAQQHNLADHQNGHSHTDDAMKAARLRSTASGTYAKDGAGERILRLPQVKALVGLGTTAIYNRMKNDDFPKPIKLGRLSGWLHSEIQEWIAEQIRATRS
jgi:prophage regulatory protein